MNVRAAGPTLPVTRRLIPVLLALGGCGITDAPPPDPDRFVNMSVVGGGEQVGLPNTQLAQPLAVRFISTVTDEPLPNREVLFSASSQSGIVLTPTRSFTDSNGIARTQVRLGAALGVHTIQINFPGNPGAPTSTTVEAAMSPNITQIAPATAMAGGLITITGENFSTRAESNEVVIDGTQARVISATSTRIDARVSECVPARNASVTVARGALVSSAVQLPVLAASIGALNPVRGQPLTIGNLACTRIAAQSADAEYLVITQHTAGSGSQAVPLRLIGLRDGAATARPVMTTLSRPAITLPQRDAVMVFHEQMREREAEILRRMAARPQYSEQIAAASVPTVGERKTFRVFVPRLPAATINAVVRAVGSRFAVYEDEESLGSIPQADLDRLLLLLEDPIYTTGVAVYGGVSDLDRNERVILLLTPAVNRLTKVGESSFITGYFDPCDLSDVSECSDTNRAEILYSVVPDPTGRWGLQHTVQNIVRLLPPLTGHELAHLIHFNQRALVSGNRTPEDLWLSEAIAHFAEDTLATILRTRGMTTEADDFARENLVRATFFLRAPEKTSLIASTGQATLEERGAGWLFLKYLNHRIGNNLLRRIETAPGTGVGTITNVTGIAWNRLMSDWAVALYAPGAPDLAGLTLPREYTFGSFDLRTALAAVSSQGFPLSPVDVGSSDFAVDWSMAPSSTGFARVRVPAGAALNMMLTGARAGDFTSAAQPQLLVLRVR